MPEFSNQIAQTAALYGSNTALAAACGLHHTIISRLVNGKNPPDPETLRKICVAVDDAEATKLLMAYLSDALPPGCAHLVRIEPAGALLQEDPMPIFDKVLKKLRPSVRMAIQHLCYLCLKDDDFADYVRKSVNVWDPDWSPDSKSTSRKS